MLLPSAHEASNELLKQSIYRAETLRLNFPGDSTNIYTKLYKRPSYGIGIYSGTFYNQAIGDPLGLLLYIKTPLIHKKSWAIITELGGGVVGNLNPYNETLNPHNAMFGSQINLFGHLALGFEYAINQPIKLGVTVGYKHFSNGFIKAPNYGLNVLPITLHGSYNLSNKKQPVLNRDIQPFKPYNRISIFVAPGTKSYGSQEKNYFVSTLGMQYIRQVGYKIGIGGGLDIFYKDSGKDKVQSNESDLAKSLSSGINTSLEWTLTEKFRINLGLGTYIARHKENDEAYPLYERIAAKFNFTKNIFAGVGIKVNKNSSDFIEWTIGYTWAKDQNKYVLE